VRCYLLGTTKYVILLVEVLIYRRNESGDGNSFSRNLSSNRTGYLLITREFVRNLFSFLFHCRRFSFTLLCKLSDVRTLHANCGLQIIRLSLAN